MRTLDSDGVLYFWQTLKNYFVAQQTGMGLSKNNFSDEAKAALDKVVADMQSTVTYVTGLREAVEAKQSPATTIAGYGITDAYVKSGNDENASETYDNNSYSNNSNSHSYSSDDGYGYDRNDPYYKKNDLDGDGKLTDEEWSNALNDFVNDIEKSGVLEENNH